MCLELEGWGAWRAGSGWLAGGAGVGARSTPVVAEVLSADKIPVWVGGSEGILVAPSCCVVEWTLIQLF